MPAFDVKGSYAGFERDGEVCFWRTQRLWELAKNLAVFEYEVASFNSFDKDVWFNTQQVPTVNNVLKHFKKIETANFDYPIILSQNGTVLDGVHRICRAYLDGRKTIPAVRFEVDPEPDRKQPVS